MTDLAIGVDVGGSSTRVVVGRGAEIVARASGPAGAIRPGRVLTSANVIGEVVRTALREASSFEGQSLVVGAAGAGRDRERDELARALRAEDLAKRVMVTTDGLIALTAAFDQEPGIVLSVGTGSIAVARDANGDLKSAGGYGWQMGDEGSGYAIGRAALTLVGHARDGRGVPTQLTDQLLEGTRSSDFDHLLRWATGAGPAEVAQLAPIVFTAAQSGDQGAASIMEQAAAELGRLVGTIRKQLSLEGPVPVALSGGLVGPGSPLRHAVVENLAQVSNVGITDKEVDPALGALLMAQRLG